MFSINYRDYGLLLTIQESIGKITDYALPFANGRAFFATGQPYEAAMMNFIVIGEMVEKLSEEFKDATARRIDWFKIKGFRNIIAHDYVGVDPDKVWLIIKDDLPALNRQLEELLKV